MCIRDRSYTLIDSDDSTQWSLPRLIVGAFDILYGAEDFDGAVQAILKMVGELFGVSRTYIFETTPDGEHGNNTFEWCAKGITPVSYTHLDVYKRQGQRR